MSEQSGSQPQRRRRRRRSRRPVEQRATAEANAPNESNDAPSERSDGGSRGGGRGGGRGSDNRGRDRGASAEPRKRTIFGLPRMSFALLAGLLVAMIALFGFQILFPASEVTEIRGIIAYPDQGRRHLAEGETFNGYNSSPPTSGPHHDELPVAGVYGADESAPFDEIPQPEQMLPLLESGGVVVYYDPAHALAEDLLAWLRLLADNRPYLSAVPIDGLAARYDGAPIVAAAWRTLLPVAAPAADEEDDDGQPSWRSQLEVFLSSGEAGYYERYVLDREGQRRLLAEAREE